MFEWLEDEILLIKTPRFHMVDGPADAKLRDALIGSGLEIPTAYREFVLKFGNAKLYRDARNDAYQIGVFAAPRESVLDSGTRIYHVGFHDGASVYMRRSRHSGLTPVFEFESDSEEKAAISFEEWLFKSCAIARNRYGKPKWLEILRGPKPFSPEENEIIEARRLMRWKVLGIDADRNRIFEITNTGKGRLVTMTVGARSKDGRLNGAIRLDVSKIGPGQTVLLRANCYGDLVAPEEVEIFALPDPKPEDREYYWEFEGLK